MIKLTKKDWRVIEFSIWKTKSLLSSQQEAESGAMFQNVLNKIGRDGTIAASAGVEISDD